MRKYAERKVLVWVEIGVGGSLLWVEGQSESIDGQNEQWCKFFSMLELRQDKARLCNCVRVERESRKSEDALKTKED